LFDCGVRQKLVAGFIKGGSAMKAFGIMLLGMAMVLFLVVGVQADDKEVTLKGTVTCAKCDLKETQSCHTVIKVKEGDKDVVYYFDKASSKKYHKPICTEAKEGTVKGTVSEMDGKKYVKVTKLELKE
jgi:Family of unknown function (DUF6370)